MAITGSTAPFIVIDTETLRVRQRAASRVSHVEAQRAHTPRRRASTEVEGSGSGIHPKAVVVGAVRQGDAQV